MIKKLSDLSIGKKAIIRSFEKNDNYIKLLEMGIIPGEQIEVEKIAPFQDPISVNVAGYKLSLRLIEAEGIIVEEITQS